MRTHVLAWSLPIAAVIAQDPPERTVAAQVTALEQRATRAVAMRALVAMGERAVPELERIVEDANAGRAAPTLPYVFECLARIGPDAVAAQDSIRAYLKVGSVDHLMPALRAYADLAAYKPLRGRREGRYLDDTSLVNNARFRLPRDVTTPEGFQRAVLAYTQDVKVNQRVRVFTEHANPHDIATLVAIIEQNLWFQREVAAEELGRKGAEASEALPVLARKLTEVHDPSAGVPTKVANRDVVLKDDFGERAAEAILRIEPDGEAAAVAHAFLVGYANDPGVRLDAMARLGRVEGDARPMVSMLRSWLAQPKVHQEVYNALGALGKRAAPALPELKKIAAGTEQPDAKLAAIAVRQIERE